MMIRTVASILEFQNVILIFQKKTLKCTNVAISRNWKIDRFLYDNDRVKRDEKYDVTLDQIGL